MEVLMEGPENIIANGKFPSYCIPFLFASFLTRPIAHHLFRAKDLCRLIYPATLDHINLSKTLDFDVVVEISLDENGLWRLQQIELLAFGPADEPITERFFSIPV